MKPISVIILIIIAVNFSFAQNRAKSTKLVNTSDIPSGERLRSLVEKNFPDGNVFIGATTSFKASSGPLGEILAREFSYITPANDFKQTQVHPEPGKWNWENSDGWLKFAKKHNQIIRVHGPISPQCSKWAKADNRTAERL